MSAWSLYRLDTGMFTEVVIDCPGHYLAPNVPDGCSCLLGEFDHLSQRVDLDTGQVVDYQPPRPSEQHEWDGNLKRWVYVPSAMEICLANRQRSYPQIAELADAVYWQANGNDAPMEAYLVKCAAVKEKYPKP